ncbi:MAG: c-type cytochrome, partial [Chloroflexi bacterium]|nr:c-type cytochrome [Chloroflexota bacterium]
LTESHRGLSVAYRSLKRARRLSVGLLGILLLGAMAVAGALGYFLLSARTALETPSDIVLLMAELGRNFVIPREVAARANPAPSNPDVIANARKVFTTRCALCHGSDGKGQTAIGSHTYPRAADLTSARVQSKRDGELYWIVENGSPHTGMPGWKGTLSDDELWQAVSYLRLLPKGESAITQLLPTPTPAPTAAPQQSKAITLTIENDYYIPEVITIPLGATVTWINKDEDVHTVTSESDPRALNSGIMEQNQTYTFTFAQPDTYKYFCEPHDFMHGVVVVQ